jgi:hypothetical protein
MPRHFTLALTALVLGASSPIWAQYGISPSLNGQFFNDLHSRTEPQNQPGGAVEGDVMYDYNKGAYVSKSDGSPVKTDAVNPNEASNPLMSTGNGYTMFSQRGAGDYTQYTGAYSASSGFFAPAFISDPFLGGRRNLKLGPVNVGFGLSTYTEYNDNINRSSADPQSGLIAGAYLNVSANYRLSKLNTLSLSSVVGYDYLPGNEESAAYGSNGLMLNVLPGTTIALDGKLGPVYVVLYDRISVRPATSNDFALASSQIFGVFQNDIGLAAQWAINSKMSLSMNYMHSDAIALEDEAEIFSRSMDSVQGNFSYSPYGTWTAGLEGGINWVRYPESFNNNGTITNAGVFFATSIGKTTSLRIAAGYQHMAFDRVGSDVADSRDLAGAQSGLTNAQNNLTAAQNNLTATEASADPATVEGIEALDRAEASVAEAQAALDIARANETRTTSSFNSSTQDNSDLSDYYYNGIITNRLSSRVVQALSFGHESALNTTSNFITADYISYGLGVIAWRGSRLTFAGYYESSEESGGRLAEEINQYGFDTYISHQLNSKLRVGLGYHYGIADSNLVDRSFTQQVFNIDAAYALSRKVNLALGYRYFITDADSDQFDFEQQRVMLTLNYNF